MPGAAVPGCVWDPPPLPRPPVLSPHPAPATLMSHAAEPVTVTSQSSVTLGGCLFPLELKTL